MYPRTVQENKFLPSGSQTDTVRGGVTEAQENECISSGVPRGLVIERLRGHALNRKGLKKEMGASRSQFRTQGLARAAATLLQSDASPERLLPSSPSRVPSVCKAPVLFSSQV